MSKEVASNDVGPFIVVDEDTGKITAMRKGTKVRTFRKQMGGVISDGLLVMKAIETIGRLPKGSSILITQGDTQIEVTAGRRAEMLRTYFKGLIEQSTTLFMQGQNRLGGKAAPESFKGINSAAMIIGPLARFIETADFGMALARTESGGIAFKTEEVRSKSGKMVDKITPTYDKNVTLRQALNLPPYDLEDGTKGYLMVRGALGSLIGIYIYTHDLQVTGNGTRFVPDANILQYFRDMPAAYDKDNSGKIENTNELSTFDIIGARSTKFDPKKIAKSPFAQQLLSLNSTAYPADAMDDAEKELLLEDRSYLLGVSKVLGAANRYKHMDDPKEKTAAKKTAKKKVAKKTGK